MREYWKCSTLKKYNLGHRVGTFKNILELKLFLVTVRSINCVVNSGLQRIFDEGGKISAIKIERV